MTILMVLNSHDLLITGQNPASSTVAAQNVLNLFAGEKAA